MEIEYNLKTTDMPNTVLEFKNSSYEKRRRFVANMTVLIIYAVMLLVLAISFIGKPVFEPILQVATIILGTYFVIFFIFQSYIIYGIVFVGVVMQKLKYDEKKLILNSSGIVYKSKGVEYKFPYSDICKVEESASYFRIWFKNGKRYICLPKRVVNDLDDFYVLLEKNLSVKLEKL